MSVSVTRVLAVALAAAAVACGGSTPEEGAGDLVSVAPDTRDISTDKGDYPVFPDADSGADPAVPAAQGGRGFTGEGWETNTDFDLIGDPRAVKGGILRQSSLSDFPATLRYLGPNITAWSAMLHGMVYETLLGLHPTSLEYIPAIATHWQVSDDRKQFRFRINPNARFSDGTPVTSADVVASWTLLVDKTLQDPARMVMFSNFEPPVAESTYIVSVRARDAKWQNFLYFSQSLFVYPAHVLKGLSGEEYIRQYNYRMLPGTGPYMVSESDVDKGNRITIRRRPDFWAERDRRSVGLNNFDEVRQIVVRDANLEFEMFKRGDLDYYNVNRAQRWMQEFDFDQMTRGLIQRRKIFNDSPQGVQGIAMNTRRPPYDDMRVRKALRHLFNRELMIKTLMFNEYELTHSIFPNSVYENESNEPVLYDPAAAVALLAEAGWTDRDSSGRLVKNGRPLTIGLTYASQESERFFTIYQEDLRRVGITLNLQLVTFETLVKQLDERTFDMVSIAYTGELFPSPEVNLHSSLADQKNNNNITGFKHARADAIMETYTREFDLEKRVALLKELDGIVTGEHHWILEWTAPFTRVAYWNTLGFPDSVLTRIGDYRDVPTLWWHDPARAAALAEAQTRGAAMAVGDIEVRYWSEREGAATVAQDAR